MCVPGRKSFQRLGIREGQRECDFRHPDQDAALTAHGSLFESQERVEGPLSCRGPLRSSAVYEAHFPKRTRDSKTDSQRVTPLSGGSKDRHAAGTLEDENTVTLTPELYPRKTSSAITRMFPLHVLLKCTGKKPCLGCSLRRWLPHSVHCASRTECSTNRWLPASFRQVTYQSRRLAQ